VDGALHGDEQASTRGASVAFSRETVALSLCPLRAASGIAGVQACAGMDAGVVSTHGLSGDAVLHRRRFVTDAVLRLQGSLRFGRHLFLAASPALVVPFVRDTFDYDWNGTQDRVFRMSAVAFEGDLAIGFRAP
jgi:hypothetical protein